MEASVIKSTTPQAVWYRKNKPIIQLRARAYYAKNRHKILAQQLARKQADPEHFKRRQRYYYRYGGGRERTAKWAKANKDKRQEIKRRWREKNPIGAWVSDRIAGWRAKPGPGSDLTTAYLVDLFKQQNGRCYYTGTTLVIHGGVVTSKTASLDRLTPNKGYVIGNVVWCSFFVNTMKGGLDETSFYVFIKNILKRRRMPCR